MTNKEYNGWHNYETWCVNLSMDNDEGSQEYWLDHAKHALRHHGENAAWELAEVIKAQHEESQPQIDGVFADLMTAALSEVNWREIAEHLIDAAKEQVEAQ